MPRTEYNDPEAEKQFKDGQRVPIPQERPSSATAEWDNSIEGKLDNEMRALRNPERSWLGKAIYGNSRGKR